MTENLTLVTGYWVVRSNKKKSIKHYLENIPKGIKLYKNVNLIFYYNEDFIKELVENVKNKETNILFIKKEINELPTWEISGKYAGNCRNFDVQKLSNFVGGKPRLFYEKAYHNRRVLLQLNTSKYPPMGFANYKEIFTIWTSKLLLVEDAIKKNYFNTTNYSWTDCVMSPNWELNMIIFFQP